VGDRVLYEEFAHNTCKITQDEEEYLIMPETEIIAII
jgi:co-chaperonin GroES (HSP10)